ncbi:cyclic nucleotide-binding domain-containing protein [Hymenobacter sp. HMF4947]|uniref:Cyclic nucleotide-binding domain-containing protein n=1 Tax=Hymenobacter ginkgonis TaxID=2682976 RepID=A0A7K1TAY0_9BACT|nr:Crp/Fnr family transcriptional regulator [Hymenobacter ginkgonis]MVN75543.1 cyclic nucleotide-binding domain-containing protein [Hymenobacter ginkgonis]
MLEWLRTQFSLSAAHWQRYATCFTRLEVPARTLLLREQEIAKRAFFIEKGCLRVWFTSQGKDVTFQFFFEQQTVSSLESFRQHTPSLFSIETIEPCVVWWVGRDDAYRLLVELAELPTQREKLAGMLFDRTRHYMEHCLSFIRDTPKQRYQQLLAQAPQVVQRVPQHYIASYLGISTVHLSRIKK